MKYGYIYRITNLITSRKYIGRTINLRKKINFYKNCKGDIHTDDRAIVKAIKKHGWDNFAFDIIWEGNTTNKGLNQHEMKYIDFYNTFKGDGYNMSAGGEDGEIHPDSIEKGRLKNLGKEPWNKGKKMTQDYCDNVSKSINDYYNSDDGYKTREKISQSNKKRFEDQNERDKISKSVSNLWKDKSYRDNQMKSHTIRSEANKKRNKKTWDMIDAAGCRFALPKNIRPFRKLKLLKEAGLSHWDEYLLCYDTNRLQVI